MIKKIFLLVSLFSFVAIHMPAADIDAQIKAIEKASPQERYKLMNAFKREVVRMKESERIRAIKKLSIINHSKRAKSVLKEIQNKERKAHFKKHSIPKRDNNRDAEERSGKINDDFIEHGSPENTENTMEEQRENETESSHAQEEQTHESPEENIPAHTQEHIEHETQVEREHEIQEETEHETEEHNEEEHDDD